jgi:hypothetical protein
LDPTQAEILPEGINWLRIAKVRELNINGEVLHNLPFLKRQEHFTSLWSWQKWKLFTLSQLPSAEGNCRIKFGFSGYF